MSALFETSRPDHQLFDETPIDASEAADIAASACVRRVKAGETLYMERDPAPFCYQVMSGLFKEYNTLKDGRRQIADFYGVGAIFGISESDVHLYTAEAVREAAVRYYPREAFLRACSSSALSRSLLDMLIARLDRSRERNIMLGRMSATQRVAVFLHHLAEERSPAGDIELPMSRQDISDHLGLTTETVCRSFTELKKKGLIAMPSARRFSVRNAARLAEFACGAATRHMSASPKAPPRIKSGGEAAWLQGRLRWDPARLR